jgi:hypothetical protein
VCGSGDLLPLLSERPAKNAIAMYQCQKTQWVSVNSRSRHLISQVMNAVLVLLPQRLQVDQLAVSPTIFHQLAMVTALYNNALVKDVDDVCLLDGA